MPSWVSRLQGITNVIDASDVEQPRRRRLQFKDGLDVVDDGDKLVVSNTQSTTAPADDAFATALAPLIRGEGLKVDANGNLEAMHRMRQVRLSESFMGNTATGMTLNWSVFGIGSPSVDRPTPLTPWGEARLLTSSAASDTAILSLGDSVTAPIVNLSAGFQYMQFGTETLTANRRHHIGFSDDVSSTSPANGVQFVYDSGVSPNWQTLVRIASVGAASVTAVPNAAGGQILSIISNGTTIDMYIDQTLVLSSSPFPGTSMNIGARTENLTAAASSIRFFGFELAALQTVGPYVGDGDILL